MHFNIYDIFYLLYSHQRVSDATAAIFSVMLLLQYRRVFISVINQIDAQNFCFTIILFHASTCFEHMCSSSGGQNCIIQHLVSSHL